MTLKDEPKTRRELLCETMSGLKRASMITFGLILVCTSMVHAALVLHIETSLVFAVFDSIDVTYNTWRYATVGIIYGVVGTLTLYAFAVPGQ